MVTSSELKGLHRLTLVLPESKQRSKLFHGCQNSRLSTARQRSHSRSSAAFPPLIDPAALKAIRGVPAGKHHMSSQECRLSAVAWVEVRASVHTRLIIHRTSSLANEGRNCSFRFFSLSPFQNLPVLSARATCPATIHDSAVAATRAPMCRNGPVAWMGLGRGREETKQA